MFPPAFCCWIWQPHKAVWLRDGSVLKVAGKHASESGHSKHQTSPLSLEPCPQDQSSEDPWGLQGRGWDRGLWHKGDRPETYV